jgi:hypothetical protein
MKKIVASVAVGLTALACAASADAYVTVTAYSQGGCTTTGVHTTSWSGGSSSTWGQSNGTAWKWMNGQYKEQDYAVKWVQGAGKTATAYTTTRQDSKTKFTTVHRGSFISGSISTSSYNPGTCS